MTDVDRWFGSSEVVVAEDGRRYTFADHHCFACGGTNPNGMRLRIEIGHDMARTTWVAAASFAT